MTTPPTASNPGTPGPSQADRDRVSRTLRLATEEGRLTSGELADRLGQALTVSSVDELNDLVADLPASDQDAGPTPPGTPWPASGESGGAGYGTVASFSGGEAFAGAAPSGAATPDRPAAASDYSLADPSAPSMSFAVFGGATRKGRWVVPPRYRAVAVFGGIDIDLTQASFASPEVTIDAYAVMGGIQILVPPDLTVNVNGVAILGGFNDGTHRQQGAPGAPVVHIKGVAAFGGVDVRAAGRFGT